MKLRVVSAAAALVFVSVLAIRPIAQTVAGVGVMLMMEEGRLRIADPVSTYIPSFKRVNGAVAGPRARAAGAGGGAVIDAPQRVTYYRAPAEREITVRDRLTHVSGL